MSSKGKQYSFVDKNTPFHHDFHYLNLNQNHNCSNVSPIQSKSILVLKNEKSANLIYHINLVRENLGAMLTIVNFWETAAVNITADSFGRIDKSLRGINNSWNKTDKKLPLKSPKALYENMWAKGKVPGKCNSVILSDEGTYDKGAEEVTLTKTWENIKKVFQPLVLQNTFEFPRQQRNENTTPEVMQFKASQRLRHANPFDEFDFEDDDEDSQNGNETSYQESTSQHQQSDGSMSGKNDYQGSMSILERLCIKNCVELLNWIRPHYMSSDSFENLSRTFFEFPSLLQIGEKINKPPRMMFQNIPNIEIQPAGFGFWLSFESKEPSFRRQKLEHDEFLNYIEHAKLESYTRELEEADEEYFVHLQLTYGSMFDNITDQMREIALEEEEEKKEAAEAKAKLEAEAEGRARLEAEERAESEAREGKAKRFQQSWTSPEERMDLFPVFFNFGGQSSDAPPATSFVEEERALAKFFPTDKYIIGNVMPLETKYHIHNSQIVNKLAGKNVTIFNEFQRLVAHLIQRPHAHDMPLSNLLLCAEPFRGFKTVLAATLAKLVVEYKRLNERGEAPYSSRFNRNPYVLVVGLEDVDCLPLYKILEEYIRGFEITMPNSRCTNVKFRKNLIHGCDILLLDRRKIDYLRDGEIDLCNLRHVIFLNVEMFDSVREIPLKDVHEIIQKTIEKKLYENQDLDEEEVNVQYIFQTYRPYTCWKPFERLFHLTEPVSNNLGVILNHDYVKGVC